MFGVSRRILILVSVFIGVPGVLCGLSCLEQ